MMMMRLRCCLLLGVLVAACGAFCPCPRVVQPPRRVPLRRPGRSVRVNLFDVVLSPVRNSVKSVLGFMNSTDFFFVFLFVFITLWRRAKLKMVKEEDPEAPKLSAFSYNFVAQTPEDEAKLKTMYCDECGFTIFVAKNRFRKHFRDGLKCLNCGAVAPKFYNLNDPNDPLNLPGATIDDFDEATYFAAEDAVNGTDTNTTATVFRQQVEDDYVAYVAAQKAADNNEDEDYYVVEEAVEEPPPIVVEEETSTSPSPSPSTWTSTPPVVAVEPPVEEPPPIIVEEETPPSTPPVVVEERAAANGAERRTDEPKTRSLAEDYKGKPVPKDLEIFRELDII